MPNEYRAGLRWSATQFAAQLRDRGYDADAVATINVWLERGDGAAIYENQDLGHPDVGHVQITSFGSGAAQLEADRYPDLTQFPPTRLPDIGNRINWRYQLIGTYRGEPVTL